MKNTKAKKTEAEKRARAARYAREYYLRKKAKKTGLIAARPDGSGVFSAGTTIKDVVTKVLALPGTPYQKIQIIEILLK